MHQSFWILPPTVTKKGALVLILMVVLVLMLVLMLMDHHYHRSACFWRSPC
jgi:hypothetical protein